MSEAPLSPEFLTYMEEVVSQAPPNMSDTEMVTLFTFILAGYGLHTNDDLLDMVMSAVKESAKVLREQRRANARSLH